MIMTAAPRKSARRPGSRSSLESMSYCPRVAVWFPGQEMNLSLDLKAATERSERGVAR
jgi:hypothetical protein